MAIRIIRPETDSKRRMIIIGDVRGYLTELQHLLNKVQYSEQDVLVFLGNMIEKGPDSLKTVQYILKLAKAGTVYAVTGNQDIICRELLREDRNAELLMYLQKQKNSVILDMCKEAGIKIQANMDMLQAKRKLRGLFAEEIKFLCELPHIIEFPNYIIAHAQILPGALEEQKLMDVLRGEGFLKKGYSFDKYVVVGHWPVQMYGTSKQDSNPVIVKNRHIICMDGGIGVMHDGQLNALVIDGNGSELSTAYEDNLPKAIIQNTQAAGEECNLISWDDGLVKPLQTYKDCVYCRQESTGKRFWIPKTYLTESEGRYYSEMITDYQMRVTLGDFVSVVETTSRGYLIKKDGLTGWYYGMLELLEE